MQHVFSFFRFVRKAGYWLFLLFILCELSACFHPRKPPALSGRCINDVITRMSDVMVHDITNPPLAARFFSYSCLAGYEIVSQNNKRYPSMHGLLNGYPAIRKPDSIAHADYRLAALLAMLQTAGKMQPSGGQLHAWEEKLLDSCREAGFDEETLADSRRYAQAISRGLLAYAKADGYNKISNLARYTPHRGDQYWFPTPPAFIAAVEPYFSTVRPFTLEAAGQFKPVPPTLYDPKRGSPFFALFDGVYREGIAAKADHRSIAAFWDCNPFAVQDEGHLQYGFKKISPGAHWLGITGIACEKAGKDFDASMLVHTVVAVGLMDAFLCCWDEKFRSNRVRPETVIRRCIDPAWTPLLQTPPFPEYLSGHSVISAASATILTHYLGEQFSYIDSVEVDYGLPPRRFSSFQQAAAEAGISRFYGGIHFMDAVNNGLQQGKLVGEWVLQKVNAKAKL
ncbi:MAG: vanadium-dependent haloperoxidase [Williamsia sp.]|nr:vanadium-dependent haloperoxidase [Williamsia sp.]